MDKITETSRNYRDLYSYKEYTQSVLIPKYFPDEDISTLNVGLIGLLTEQTGVVTEDVFNTASLFLNEFFPNKATLPESIYTYAGLFQLSNSMGSAASCRFLIIVNEQELLNLFDQAALSSTGAPSDCVYISKNTTIYLEDTPFVLDYDIEITRKKTKLTRSSAWSYGAKYMITPYTNSISSITSPYIKIRKSIDGQLALEVVAHQCVREEVVESVIDNTGLNYTVFDETFDGVLAGVDVFYKPPGDDTYTQLDLLVANSLPQKDPFCYYNVADDNVLRISFAASSSYFQPEFNSEVKIVMYLSKGEDGNFESYNGSDISIVADTEDYSYNNNFMIAALATSSALGGRDSVSLEDLRKMVIQGFSTANALTTDNDLETYFYSFESSYKNQIKFIKRRDDLFERLYSGFLIMKNNDYIYPTNTLDVDTNYLEWRNTDGGYIFTMDPGYVFEYDGSARRVVPMYINGFMDRKAYINFQGQTVYEWIYRDYFYWLQKIDPTAAIGFDKDDVNWKTNWIHSKNEGETFADFIENELSVCNDCGYHSFDMYIEPGHPDYDISKADPDTWRMPYCTCCHGNNITVGGHKINDFFSTVYDNDDRFEEKLSNGEFLFSNPFLMSITKNPGLINYYLTIVHQTSLLDFIEYNEITPLQFIINQMTFYRDLTRAKEYTARVVVASSIEWEPEELVPGITKDNYEGKRSQLSNNYLRVVLVIQSGGVDVCYLEMVPEAYNENDQFVFACRFRVNDHVTMAYETQTDDYTIEELGYTPDVDESLADDTEYTFDETETSNIWIDEQGYSTLAAGAVSLMRETPTTYADTVYGTCGESKGTCSKLNSCPFATLSTIPAKLDVINGYLYYYEIYFLERILAVTDMPDVFYNIFFDNEAFTIPYYGLIAELKNIRANMMRYTISNWRAYYEEINTSYTNASTYRDQMYDVLGDIYVEEFFALDKDETVAQLKATDPCKDGTLTTTYGEWNPSAVGEENKTCGNPVYPYIVNVENCGENCASCTKLNTCPYAIYDVAATKQFEANVVTEWFGAFTSYIQLMMSVASGIPDTIMEIYEKIIPASMQIIEITEKIRAISSDFRISDWSNQFRLLQESVTLGNSYITDFIKATEDMLAIEGYDSIENPLDMYLDTPFGECPIYEDYFTQNMSDWDPSTSSYPRTCGNKKYPYTYNTTSCGESTTDCTLTTTCPFASYDNTNGLAYEISSQKGMFETIIPMLLTSQDAEYYQYVSIDIPNAMNTYFMTLDKYKQVVDSFRIVSWEADFERMVIASKDCDDAIKVLQDLITDLDSGYTEDDRVFGMIYIPQGYFTPIKEDWDPAIAMSDGFQTFYCAQAAYTQVFDVSSVPDAPPEDPDDPDDPDDDPGEELPDTSGIHGNFVYVENKETKLIPMTDVVMKIVVLTKDYGVADSEQTTNNYPNSRLKFNMTGYQWTNVYNTATDKIDLIKPLSMIRSSMYFRDDRLYNVKEGDIYLYSVPFLKYSLMQHFDEDGEMIKDDTGYTNYEMFTKFIQEYFENYQNMELVLADRLKNVSHIDLKFYNTYGKSKNYLIGDADEVIDRVNMSICFYVYVTAGTDLVKAQTDLKTFIKETIESLNRYGSNDMNISNLIRKIENNFSYVDHLKFIGINGEVSGGEYRRTDTMGYSTDYQTIKNITTDLDDLDKDERFAYVPEMLCINKDQISLVMFEA